MKKLSDDMKHRLTVYGAGFAVGTVLSVLLFQYADIVESQPHEVEKLDVVLTRCDVHPGEAFERRCAEVRTVAYQFVPPGALQKKDLSWHIGRTFDVALDAGDVIRTADFRDPKK